MNFIVGQAVTLTELNYFQPMHYSKHTRTSSYINSALPSQGQALSLGLGNSLFNPCSTSNCMYCYQYLEWSGLPDTTMYLWFSKAEGSDVRKKKGLETDGNRPTWLEVTSTHQWDATEKLFAASRISTSISINKWMSGCTQDCSKLGTCLVSILYR